MSEEIVPGSLTKAKTVHVLPEISLDSTDLPQIKDYDVGDTYDAIIHCEMISKHQGSPSMYGESENPSIIRGRFKIISIKSCDDEYSTNNKASGKLRAINRRLSK